MLVSIIVPIYNVDKYLEECILGVLSQSYLEWELLLIDDGSTDLSGNICKSYTNVDKRIRVISKQNTGVSDTRNIGLDAAQGEYCIFLDADDYWYDSTALEKLVAIAEKYNLDIVRGEYKAVDQDGCDLFERPLTQSKIEYSQKILSPGLFYTKILCGEHFLVLSLIKRNVINSLRFNVKRVFLEDMEFYVHLLLQPLRCMFVPIRFYAYRKLNTSASNIPKIKNLIDSFSMCDVFEECSKVSNDNELLNAYRVNSIMMYYWTLDTITLDYYFPKRNEIINELNLRNLQQRVYNRSKLLNANFSIVIKMSPIIGVWILKIRHLIGFIIRKFIKR